MLRLSHPYSEACVLGVPNVEKGIAVFRMEAKGGRINL